MTLLPAALAIAQGYTDDLIYQTARILGSSGRYRRAPAFMRTLLRVTGMRHVEMDHPQSHAKPSSQAKTGSALGTFAGVENAPFAAMPGESGESEQ